MLERVDGRGMARCTILALFECVSRAGTATLRKRALAGGNARGKVCAGNKCCVGCVVACAVRASKCGAGSALTGIGIVGCGAGSACEASDILCFAIFCLGAEAGCVSLGTGTFANQPDEGRGS